jgi:hypothetical protein
MPTVSLVNAPGRLPTPLHRPYNAPLPPCASTRDTASVTGLMPENFRRRIARPVSYYALFKGMAASKPTSWLSRQSNLL